MSAATPPGISFKENKMNIPMYQVDAFTATVFSGNPAAVCLLDTWLDDTVLQAVAAENNLSETAFLVQNTTGFDLRWFTPVTEVALCGHATLASAFVQFYCQHWNKDTILFDTRHSGQLTRHDGIGTAAG
jgi:PhzF family phenazine biosynthesis protein